MTTAAAAARDLHGRGSGVKSREASQVLDFLLGQTPVVRRGVLRELTTRDMQAVYLESQREHGTMYVLWRDSPSAFVEDVIGDTIWSRQRMILDAMARPDVKRLAVPAGMGVGKTWIAGRLVAWAGSVYPPGSIVIVTTATRFRQVRNQMWPHIRNAVAKGGLPGWCDTTQWKITDSFGNDVLVAYGFSAPDNDEAAMQGIHGTPYLLLVVDEAGGIMPMIGRGTNNILTGDAKMLAIGNPSMSEMGTWFEELCLEGQSDEATHATTHYLKIATYDSPAVTGEPTPICRACQYNPDGHRISLHLPNQDWIDRTITSYGDETHPYVVAKVKADFPKSIGSVAIPPGWVEAAVESEDPEPDGETWLRACDLGVDGYEGDEFTVSRGAWVRLGIDVAADGGDEVAIIQATGDVLHNRYSQSGSANANQVQVALKMLEYIKQAERFARALRSPRRVRVKVDKNGLGHGVVGMLQTWGPEGTRQHSAEIVGVMVSESPKEKLATAAAEGGPAPGALMNPHRKRDEMWLTTRQLLLPDPATGVGRLRLRVDEKTWKQLSLPRLGEKSTGEVVIESKDHMRKRGVSSPDRAEALLLALYEPEVITSKKRRGLLV